MSLKHRKKYSDDSNSLLILSLKHAVSLHNTDPINTNHINPNPVGDIEVFIDPVAMAYDGPSDVVSVTWGPTIGPRDTAYFKT